MTEIGPYLERLSLRQYHDAFVAEGFDTWESVLDIQENDLETLGVKLGHRRKLQRAIAEFRGYPSDRPLRSPSLDTPVSENTRSESISQQASSSRDTIQPTGTEQKRKYRRHPKPDEHAPEKPPSAYVLFSNKVREEVKHENLSFTDIARLVGERWQKLSPAQKEPFETHAASLKDTYNAQLTEYKKTDAYKDYVQYLADFKAKHGHINEIRSEAKRPRLEPQYSSSLSAASGGEVIEITPQAPGHSRGASIGSVGSTQTTNASVGLQVVTALPSLGGVSGRRGSPTNQYLYERRPGQLSNESSVSEEYGDPLPRAATLSLNTPPAGTPPPSTTVNRLKRQELGHGLNPQPWQRENSQIYSGTISGVNSTSIYPAAPSGLGFGEPLRNGVQDMTRTAYPAGALQQQQPQKGSLPISQLVGANLGHDQSTVDAQRILPPLHQFPGSYSQFTSVGQSPVSVTTSTYQYQAPPDTLSLRPGHIRSMPSRSESEAADTLAGLSEQQSFDRTRAPRPGQ